MFIYNSQLNLSLRSYGIEVPLLSERPEKLWQWVSHNIGEKFLVNQSFPATSFDDLKKVHDDKYIQQLQTDPESAILTCFELIQNGQPHRYNPQNAQKKLVQLTTTVRQQLNAAYYNTQIALKHQFSYLFAGGLHHAMTDQGRGFCLLNDIVYAAKKMQQEFNLQQIWIIDVDAHKGDGTAQMTVNDTSITTLSIHMQNGWPLDSDMYDQQGKLNPWFIASDIDIPIAINEEKSYLAKLEQGLKQLEQNFPRAQLAIIVNGSDPYERDSLPSADQLKLNKLQMLERDILVYEFLEQFNIPQAYVMSGGYGDQVHEIPIQFFKWLKQRGLFC